MLMTNLYKTSACAHFSGLILKGHIRVRNGIFSYFEKLTNFHLVQKSLWTFNGCPLWDLQHKGSNSLVPHENKQQKLAYRFLARACVHAHTHTHTHMCMQTHKQADQQQHWWLWSLFQWNTITLPGADSNMQSVWTGKGRHFVVVGWIIKACLIAAISLFDAGIFLKPFWSEMKNLVPRICTLRNAVTSYQFSWPLDLFLRV